MSIKQIHILLDRVLIKQKKYYSCFFYYLNFLLLKFFIIN